MPALPRDKQGTASNRSPNKEMQGRMAGRCPWLCCCLDSRVPNDSLMLACSHGSTPNGHSHGNLLHKGSTHTNEGKWFKPPSSGIFQECLALELVRIVSNVSNQKTLAYENTTFGHVCRKSAAKCKKIKKARFKALSGQHVLTEKFVF